jgi:hypothetical protein
MFRDDTRWFCGACHGGDNAPSHVSNEDSRERERERARERQKTKNAKGRDKDSRPKTEAKMKTITIAMTHRPRQRQRQRRHLSCLVLSVFLSLSSLGDTYLALSCLSCPCLALSCLVFVAVLRLSCLVAVFSYLISRSSFCKHFNSKDQEKVTNTKIKSNKTKQISKSNGCIYEQSKKAKTYVIKDKETKTSTSKHKHKQTKTQTKQALHV